MARTAPSVSIEHHGAAGDARCRRYRLSAGVERLVLGGLLHVEVDRRARGQHVLAAALRDALHLLEGPVEEPVGAVGVARLDDLGRVDARGVHLAGAHEAGLDEIVEHVVGAGARGRQVDVRGELRSAP